uniref:RBR-type E3 ubiquitin transferase n=1 Tax=Arcella intermedia TaxID=1963864 RepID=A0A6B2LEK7_9EUKA
MTPEKREQYMKLKEAENKTIDCAICYDSVNIRDTYTFDSCFHRFCRDCLKGYIQVEINEGNIQRKGKTFGLKCPGNTCSNILAPHDIKNVVDKATYDRYDSMLRDLAIENMSDVSWCPTPGCGNALIQDSHTIPLLVCYTCKHTWCAKCNVPWHFESTCQSYQAWLEKLRSEKKLKEKKELENDEAYKRWIKQYTKPCPKCSSPIDKNGGCNHMTCRNCGYHFCWICLKHFDGYSHFGRSSCAMFS